MRLNVYLDEGLWCRLVYKLIDWGFKIEGISELSYKIARGRDQNCFQVASEAELRSFWKALRAHLKSRQMSPQVQ